MPWCRVRGLKKACERNLPSYQLRQRTFGNSILRHNITADFLVNKMRALDFLLRGMPLTAMRFTSTPGSTTCRYLMLRRSFRVKSSVFVAQHAAQQFSWLLCPYSWLAVIMTECLLTVDEASTTRALEYQPRSMAGSSNNTSTLLTENPCSAPVKAD